MPSLAEALKRVGSVQFLKRSEIAPAPISDIIFTGTGLRFYQETIKTNGSFIIDKRQKVFLTNSTGYAINAAKNRSYSHHDKPIVLVVNSNYPNLNPRREGLQQDIVVDRIPLEAIIAVYEVNEIKDGDVVMFDDSLEVLKQKGKKIV